MLGLDHDPACAAPALAGAVGELIEHPARPLGLEEALLGLTAGLEAAGLEPIVLGQAQHEVDLVGLAPGHDLLAAEARVAADDDLHLGPALAHLRHDRGELLDAARAGVDVGGAQARTQQRLAPEDVQRQVAVVAVVAVEEAPLLVAVEWVIGGIEIEPDLLGRVTVRVQGQADHQRIDPGTVGGDLLVA